MKILCLLIVHNAAQILPFTFRHYDPFVDEYWIYDDHSTDGTLAMLQAHPRVKLLEYDQPEGLYEEINQFLIYRTYPQAAGKFDWVMVPDPDEFLMPDVGRDVEYVGQMMRSVLNFCLYKGFEVVEAKGFNLVGPEFPKDDGHSQIYELNPQGVNAPIYSKPIVFRPQIMIRWMRGKHQLEHCNPVLSPPVLKLLHARYFGADYTRQRNAENYHRLGLKNGDKGPGWSVRADYDGEQLEGSPSWADWAQSCGFDVLRAQL